MLRRLISGLVASAGVLAIPYFLGNTAFVYACLFICFIVCCEYSFLKFELNFWSALSVASSFAVLLAHVFYTPYTLLVLLMSFLLLVTTSLKTFKSEDAEHMMMSLFWSLLGLLYVGLLPALSVKLLNDQGFNHMLYLFVAVFFGDIGAYFGGKTLGKKKIFPVLSPKKTYAGTYFGLVASGVFGGLFLWMFLQTPLLPAIILSSALGAVAQVGDFFESLCKRVAGKKDSGRLMPGHGGFLDRLDGIYFGSILLYTYHWTGWL